MFDFISKLKLLDHFVDHKLRRPSEYDLGSRGRAVDGPVAVGGESNGHGVMRELPRPLVRVRAPPTTSRCFKPVMPRTDHWICILSRGRTQALKELWTGSRELWPWLVAFMACVEIQTKNFPSSPSLPSNNYGAFCGREVKAMP